MVGELLSSRSAGAAVPAAGRDGWRHLRPGGGGGALGRSRVVAVHLVRQDGGVGGQLGGSHGLGVEGASLAWTQGHAGLRDGERGIENQENGTKITKIQNQRNGALL